MANMGDGTGQPAQRGGTGQGPPIRPMAPLWPPPHPPPPLPPEYRPAAVGWPPGRQPPPWPAPGQSGPPRRSKQPVVVALAVAAALAAVLCAGLALVAVRNVGPGGVASPVWQDGPELVATNDLAEAAETLLAAPGTRYTGWLVHDGDRVEVDAQVTREGSTTAVLTVAGERVDLLDTGDGAFVRAGQSFWEANGAPADAVAQYASQWVKVPGDLFGLDLGDALAPVALAGALAPGVGSDADSAAAADPPTLGPESTIDGVPVRAVHSGDITVHVTTASPKRVLRIERTATAASPTTRNTVWGGTGGFRPIRAPGDDDFEFDPEDMTPEEVDELFQTLEQRINELRNSVDSQVRFSLNGSITLAPCTTTGCQANLQIRNTVTSGSPYLQVNRPVQATVTIAMTLDGRPVRTCVQQVTMQPNGSAAVTCFAAYYIPPSRNPRTHQVRAVARAVARAMVEADLRKLVDDVRRELARNRNKRQPRATPSFVDTLPSGSPVALNPAQQQARDRVAELARRACREVRRLPGESATVWGTRVHSRLSQLIRAERNPKLFSEYGYYNGGQAPRVYHPGAGRRVWKKGSAVPDVVYGPSPLQPEFFIDLKTGDTGLDPDWYDKLNRNLPHGYQNLPVLTVRC